MTAIGFRILHIPKRPDKKLVAELAGMVTPHLSDSMQRLYGGGPQLRPMHNGAKLCGPAFTVRTAPGDNLLIHKAIDSAEPRQGSFPVYASGVTHRGPYKNGPGEINVPITVGGMPVNPGDIIVGDADGLVAVPQEQAEEILASAKSILTKEEGSIKQIRAGTVDRSWVDKALKEKGYKV